MARELTVHRLLATTFVALTVALASSGASTSTATIATTAMAAKATSRGGDGENARLPGTLPNGAPIKMPDLESLAVVLPFSLRKELGLTNITDITQAFAPGAFCEGAAGGNAFADSATAGSSSSSVCDRSGAAEKATQSKLPFHAETADVSTSPAPHTVSLQHVLETTDETFLLFFYDSLDSNSYRNAALVDEAAGLLRGYVTTVGVDIRRDDLQWLLNVWGIQLTPSLRLLRPTRMMATTRQGLTNYDSIVQTIGNTGSHLQNNLNAALSPTYSLFAGTKQPIDIAPNGNQMAMLSQESWAPEVIKKFALGGGKSLESENTVETLAAGDKAAETVFDLIRGAHPLTFVAREMLKPDAAPVANIDSFTASYLASPFYNRRGQVPKAVVVLFTDKDGALNNLYKAVALRYNNRAVFVTVNGKEKAPQLAAAFGVKSFPTFAVVKPPQSVDYKSSFDLREQLISGQFSKKRSSEDDVFAQIKTLLHKDDGNLRLFTPQEGTTLSINDIMRFMDASSSSPSTHTVSLSQSGIVPSSVLYTLQRQATRDAFYYQQQRANNLVTPITSKKDWLHQVFAHAGVVASGPIVAKPTTAPIITVGLIFTGSDGAALPLSEATNAVPNIIRQEINDVRGRLKDNYFVSIPKANAAAALKYFKNKCADDGSATGESDSATTDIVFIYARLQPLSTAAAAGLSATAAAAAFAPNFIIDYSCKTPSSAEETSSVLSSAMKLDKLVHYGAKKGFAGFGGSEKPPTSFDWSEVPLPKF